MKVPAWVWVGGAVVLAGGAYLLLRKPAAAAVQPVVQNNPNVNNPAAQAQAITSTASSLINSGANLVNQIGSLFSS